MKRDTCGFCMALDDSQVDRILCLDEKESKDVVLGRSPSLVDRGLSPSLDSSLSSKENSLVVEPRQENNLENRQEEEKEQPYEECRDDDDDERIMTREAKIEREEERQDEASGRQMPYSAAEMIHKAVEMFQKAPALQPPKYAAEMIDKAVDMIHKTKVLQTPQSAFDMIHKAVETMHKTQLPAQVREPQEGSSTRIIRTNLHIPPVKEIYTGEEQSGECDFDRNPTSLYLALLQKQWQAALLCIEKAPDQAKIWVSRKDPSGQIIWRLLPIHAAVIFRAPEIVVEALLKANPEGIRAKDDQGMLPVHLSYRVDAISESVVSLLLERYPESLQVTDGKGRTPTMLANTPKGSANTGFWRAVLRQQAWQQAVVEQQDKAKEAVQRQACLQKELLALQTLLVTNQGTSRVLVEHITALEAQIKERDYKEEQLKSVISEQTNKLEEQDGQYTQLLLEQDELRNQLNMTTKDLKRTNIRRSDRFRRLVGP